VLERVSAVRPVPVLGQEREPAVKRVLAVEPVSVLKLEQVLMSEQQPEPERNPEK